MTVVQPNKRSRRRKPLFQIDSPYYRAAEYGAILVGSFIVALSFNVFLSPNQVASGGVSGISIIVQEYAGIRPAFTQWALNLPLFFLGLWLLGKRFGAKTLLGSILLPLFVLLTQEVRPLTTNLLLASIYGGVGVGIGIGIVFRGRGSTGGMDLAAQILHKYTGLSLGLCVALFDGLIIAGAGFAFTPEKALYALIGLFVTSKTIDFTQVGFAHSKIAYIISQEQERLKKAILHELDRGLTILNATGGYSGEKREVLMVVVSVHEVMRLKAIVRSLDESAFVIIGDAFEVLGEGFKIE